MSIFQISAGNCTKVQKSNCYVVEFRNFMFYPGRLDRSQKGSLLLDVTHQRCFGEALKKQNLTYKSNIK